MSAINRDITRAAIDQGSLIDVTQQVKTPNTEALSFALTTTDKFYIVLDSPFTTRHFQLAIASNAISTVSVKTWDGTAFTAVEDLIDQTNGFTKSGFISWINNSDWKVRKAAPFADLDMYWAEITVSSDLSAGTTLQSVLNIFCDDDSFEPYYPDIFNDPQYLPVGKTNFISQYILAKDMVVNRLRKDGLIKKESQIIDINEVAAAAVHATAYIILSPIAQEEGDVQRAKDSESKFVAELNRIPLSLDHDETGVIEEDEKNLSVQFFVRGRA